MPEQDSPLAAMIGTVADGQARLTAMPDLEERVAALEAAVAELVQPEPDFMSQVRVEPVHARPLHSVLTVSLTHEPTSVTVVARDRTEGVYKLRRALAAHARRLHDLQEQQRRQERKAAKEAP